MLRNSVTCLLLWLSLCGGLSAAPTRIALLADTHTTRGTKDQQPLYRGRLEQVIDSVNASTVSLVLIAGDLTESAKDEEFADFKKQIARFKSPVYYVPGNHDVGTKWTPSHPDTVSTMALARYEQQLGPYYFTTSTAGLHIIGLNSSILGSALPQAEQQWNWLVQTLKSDKVSTSIVFMHYPPFRDFYDEPGGGYWSIEPKPRARLLELLKQVNVRAVLTGHTHLPLVNHYRGIPILTAQPVSFGIPRGKQPQGWTLVSLSDIGDVHAEYINLEN